MFYHVYNHYAQPSGLRRDKTHAANLLNGFESIRGKLCVNRVHHNLFVNVRNYLTSKALGNKLVCKSTWGPVPEFFEILKMPRKREI